MRGLVTFLPRDDGSTTHMVIYKDHMARKVTATETKARLLSLLDEVASGEELEITKRGRVVARLVPARGPHALRGALQGVAVSAAEEVDLFSTGVAWEAA